MWEIVKENENVTMENVESMYEDLKVVKAAVEDTGKVEKPSERTFFAESQNLIIMMARLPKHNLIIKAVEHLVTVHFT